MKQAIFRLLFILTTVCFVGEDLCQTFGWHGRDLAEITEKNEEKKGGAEEKFDSKIKFLAFEDFAIPLIIAQDEALPPLVCSAPFAILPAHLSIFSPPPNVAAA